jgi:hypothetical protein
MKNTSIVLIAVVAAVMVAGMLAVTLETGQAFANLMRGNSMGGANGVNGGSGGPGNSDFGHSHQGASGGLRVKPVEG